MLIPMSNKWKALEHLQKSVGRAENRMRPRFIARDVNCERGTLMVFSSTGLRVKYNRQPKFEIGHVIDMELFSNLGQHNCSVEAVRITKKGFRTYEVGFRFTDEEAAKQMQLFRLGFDPLADGQWSIR